MIDIAPDATTDPKYFTKAVTELGEKCQVLTTQAIFNDRGIKILEKGVQVNAGLYDRLMAHTLTIPIEDAVASVPTVNGALLRAQAQAAMREVPFFERLGADPKLRSLLLDVLEKMPLPSPMAFQLTLAYEVRPALFRHSLHMALFAAWMATGPLVMRFDVTMAAAAGLLHDIGMLHLDPILLAPRDTIHRDQRRQLYSHALISTALIERHHEYPRELLRAVREHHEFLNGSGYPLHLSHQAISPLGRILSLGELVTTILGPEREASELRLSVLLRMNRQRYDETLIERVVQNLQPHSTLHSPCVTLMGDPVHRLLAIDAVLSEWPNDLAQQATLGEARREVMAFMAIHVAQFRRTLATVGVAPQQLAQLGTETRDDFLQMELTLLAQEAAWQLRSLARQTRRRWQRKTDDSYPDTLRAWLNQVDALVASIHPASPSESGHSA